MDATKWLSELTAYSLPVTTDATSGVYPVEKEKHGKQLSFLRRPIQQTYRQNQIARNTVLRYTHKKAESI